MYLKIVILIMVLLYLLVLKMQYKQVGSYEYNKARKRLAVFTAILLILQSGLRHVGVGPDTYQYMLSFQDCTHWSWQQVFQNFIDVYQYDEGKDAGYVLLMKIFSIFSKDYQTYLMFVAIAVFVPILRFIYKNTERLEDIWFALLLYFALFYSFFSVTGIRQALATGICLWSVEYIKDKKLFPFLVLMGISALIHKSSLLFLPFFWIAQIRRPRAMLVLMLCLFPLMASLGNAFALQLAIISGSENYLGYAEEKSVGANNLIVFYLFMTLVGYIRFWKYNELIKKRSYIFNAISLGIFFLPLTLNSANLVRVVQYYSIFLLVFISYVFSPISSDARMKLAIQLMQVLLIAALLYKLFCTPVDYAFFWQNMQITNY